MTNFHQNLAQVASARLFELKLLEILETLIVTICMGPLSGLTTHTYVDGLHGPHPTQETMLLRFYVQLTNGHCVFLRQLSSADLPPELCLASALKLEKQLFSHIFTKKVKRQCSSKTVMKSKATAEVPKQDRE